MAKSEWKKAKEKFLHMQKDGRLEEIEDVPQEVEEKAKEVVRKLMKESEKSDK